MHALSGRVAAWLAAHHGVATRAQLLELGLTRHQINTLTSSGVLLPVACGVHRLAGAPATWDQRLAAVCAVAPLVAVSHHTAGRLWGLRRLGPDQRLHVLVPGRANWAIRGAVVHRCHRIDAIDLVERADGIRLTSPARTAFDLAGRLHDEALTSIVEQLLNDERCTFASLVATKDRLHERGRPGSARMARVLDSRPAEAAPVDSDLELTVERAILAAGLPRPERQAPVHLLGGTIVHVDFLWRKVGEGLEVDHMTWHGGAAASSYDRWHDRQLRQVGINVTRISDLDVAARLPAILHDLRPLLTRSRAG